MFGYTDGEWRLLTVVLVLGLVVGLPAAVIGIGYLAYRIAAAAWRGW